MNVTSFRARFIAATDIFALCAPISETVHAADALMRAVRTYYLVLPQKALKPDWQLLGKGTRRSTIRAHLQVVCLPDTVSESLVHQVDLWTTRRQNQRTALIGWGRLLEAQYGTVCFICGVTITERKSVDHVFPLIAGGEESADNLRLAHIGCNSAKNDRLPGDGIRWAHDFPLASEDNIPVHMKYLVYLRDDFTCTEAHCRRGLFSRDELRIRRVVPSGICCYDNLRTSCATCASE